MNLLNYRLFSNLNSNAFLNPKYIFLRNKRLKATAVVLASGVAAAIVIQNQNNGIFSSFGAGIRFLRSLKIGIVISLDYYFSQMGLNEKSTNYKPMMSLIHKRAATRILEGCLINGGTYIKLGQGLVSLSHILPAEYIDILEVLQDKCLEHSSSEIYDIIKEDFGKEPCEMFNSIENKSIAAASLAQVFKGETVDGDIVAIKVQYIDLQSRFVSDIATIDFLLKIIGFIHPDFNFGWVLTDLTSSLKQELDFLNEGANSERCARDLKKFKYVHIPKVYWQFSSSRFLVTEFVDAIKINEIDKLRNEGFSLYDIDLKISEMFAHQIFQTGFVHADPHPGNLFVRSNNKSAQIILLDHGLYQEIDRRTRMALRGMWTAIVLKDCKGMSFYANCLGVKNHLILAEILTQRPVKITGFTLTARITEEQMIYMTEAAKDRFNEIMQVLKIMPRSLLLIVRNLNTIRSIIHDHGDPIDRYAVLARSACTIHTYRTSLLRTIKALCNKTYFEFKLFTGRIWVWFVKTYLKTLMILGRSPDTTALSARLC